MNFITWHYSYGISFYIRRYLHTIRALDHYFTLGLLLQTLFAPYKRLIDYENKPGFNLTREFEKFSFNLISRVMGAIVRVGLFLTGVIALVGITLLGAVGLFFWALLPFFSIGVYRRYKRNPKHELVDLFAKSTKEDLLENILSNPAGVFMAMHLGVSKEAIFGAVDVEKVTMPTKKIESYSALFEYLIEQEVWPERDLRKLALKNDDIKAAALWWDEKWASEVDPDDDPPLGRPGFGMELLFGYTPTLSQLSVDLSKPQAFNHRLIGRENIVSRIERTLVSDTNVVLVGKPGIGKKTIVLEFARRSAEGLLNKKMTYKRILEFDHNFLLSESLDLNQKKVKLGQTLAEAAAAGNVILVVRDLHRLTDRSLDGLDFTDVFDKYLEQRKIKLIAISTRKEYERYLSQNMRLRKYFEIVEATQPTKGEAMEILIEAANTWEQRRAISILVPALRRMIDSSDQFISEVPFPEKAIEILDAAIVYVEQNRRSTITVDDVNAVIAERTGVPFARLTESEKSKLGSLEDIIHERLINQHEAVTSISKILRAKAVQVIKSGRPIGSFLFLGPTGVGKTETAKVLSNVYFGSQEKILRFDMAEFAGSEGLERLIGSVGKNQPGALTTAIKNNPASLLLLDEIEKAPREVFNLFLSLLDEGKITDAFGREVGAKNLFVIATSNAGSEHIRDLVGKNTNREDMQKSVVDYVLKQGLFSPEFINRFDGTIVYEPLSKEHLIQVAALMFKDLSENLKEKGIELETGEDAWARLAEDGYEPAFGARPMRRIIEQIVGDVIGKAILSEQIGDGDKIRLIGGKNKNEYTIQKVAY